MTSQKTLRPRARMVVAIIAALFGGSAWTRLAPDWQSHAPPSPVEMLLFCAGFVATFLLLRSTACGTTALTRDQLVRRLAALFAAVVTWFLAGRMIDHGFAADGILAIALALGFVGEFVLFLFIVGPTVDRLKEAPQRPADGRLATPAPNSPTPPAAFPEAQSQCRTVRSRINTARSLLSAGQ